MSFASEPSPSSSTNPQAISEEKLRRLPASAADDFRQFCSTGDDQALRRLLVEVLKDHLPDRSREIASWDDSTRLVDHLGFDSLAIAEMIFYFEDLFRISISNEEILQVQTLGDLHAYVKGKYKNVAS